MGTAAGFALFHTAIGSCGIGWSDAGVTGVQLPEGDEAATRARLVRRWPAASEAPPPAPVRQAIEAITALLLGEAPDLNPVALDLERVPEFNRRVYLVARTIPPGETMTYGEIAARLGNAADARAVGKALAQNPFALIVPCHRVLAAGGKIGGFSAGEGRATKLRLLALEGRQAGPLFRQQADVERGVE
jgi:methylated-DNA-[protein]-cysteine S-methyltransferase